MRNFGKEVGMLEDAPMYVYATEMVSKYYSALGVSGKSLLSVCGSGDQILNAYLLGAKRVVGFDINFKAGLFTRLKIAAVRTLEYREFMDFFGRRGRRAFEYRLYKRVREMLDARTTGLFDGLYEEFKQDGGRLYHSDNFRQRAWFVGGSTDKINAYLTSEARYLKLRGILGSLDFKFVQHDIERLSECKELKGQRFDLINTSNVPNYISRGLRRAGHGDPCEYIVNMIGNLFPLVSRGGRVFYYAYSPATYTDQKPVRPVPPTGMMKNFVRFRDRWDISEKRFRGVMDGYDKVMVFGRKTLRE